MKKPASFSKSSPGALLSILAVCFTLLAGCSDDPAPAIDETEEPELSCLPQQAKKPDASVFDYTYDDNDRLTKFELSSGSIIKDRYSIQYEEDVITSVVVDRVQKQEAGPEYEIIYSGDGKPAEVRFYNVHTDTDVHSTVKFTHDNSGRIATKEYYTEETWKHTVRYEYNAEGNVAKTFITKVGGDEYLASEFPSYDDQQRFFSASPELTLLELYLFDYEPSVNNALKQLIHADESETYSPAVEVDFTLGYDENNYVKSLNNQDGTAANTLLFVSMTYQCE